MVETTVAPETHATQRAAWEALKKADAGWEETAHSPECRRQAVTQRRAVSRSFVMHSSRRTPPTSRLAVGNSGMNTGDEVAFSEQNSLKKP